MLNEFKLFAAVNESIENGGMSSFESISSIEPYSFGGMELEEAASFMNQEIMAEAVSYAEFSVGADEILSEAALMNPDKVAVLSENVFTNVLSALRKLIDKLIGMVKGLINKIKAFWYKFTGKRDKWIKLMEKKVTETKNSKFTYMMWEWDEGYLTSTLPDSVNKLVATWKEKFAGTTFKQYIQIAKDVASTYGKGTKINEKDESKKDAYLTSAIEHKFNIKEGEREYSDEQMAKLITGDLGTNGNTVADAVNDIYKKAHSDKSEKTEINVESKRGSMLTFIKGCDAAIKKVQKAYDEDLKALADFKKELGGDTNISFEGQSDFTDGNANAIRGYLKARIDYLSRYTTAFHSVVSKASTINTNCLRDCAGEYMTALSKYAGTKEKKED